MTEACRECGHLHWYGVSGCYTVCPFSPTECDCDNNPDGEATR